MRDKTVRIGGRLRTRLCFTCMEGIFWPAMCASYLLVILLQERGFSNTAIGAVLAVNALIGVVVQPVWGMLCDRLGSVKRVFLLCGAVTTVSFTAVAFTQNRAAIIALLLTDAVFRCSMVMLLDSWLVAETKRAGLDYGSIRVAGSITYSAVSYLYGSILVRHGMREVILVSCVWSLINFALAFFAPEHRKDGGIPAREAVAPVGIKQLAVNRPFIATLFFLFFLSAASFGVSNYMPNILRVVGGEANVVGYAQSLKAVAEIPFFLMSGAILAKVSARRLMVFSAGLYLAAFTGFYFARSAVVILIMHVFAGAGYSLMLAAKLRYISQLVPPGLMATAFTLTGAFEAGLGSILSSLVGGAILDRAPASVLLLLAIGITILGVIVFIAVSGPGPRRREHNTALP